MTARMSSARRLLVGIHIGSTGLGLPRWRFFSCFGAAVVNDWSGFPWPPSAGEQRWFGPRRDGGRRALEPAFRCGLPSLGVKWLTAPPSRKEAGDAQQHQSRRDAGADRRIAEVELFGI